MEASKLIATFLFVTLAGCQQHANDKSEQESSNSSKPDILFYSKTQLDSILKVAALDTSRILSLGTAEILDKGEGGEPYYLIKRTVPGYVEMHEQWDDVVIIRSGSGILRTGRNVTGKKLLEGKQPWRNWYDGQIIDPKELKVSAGDFVIIPAMTGHQYIPNNKDTLTYWTIKIKRLK